MKAHRCPARAGPFKTEAISPIRGKIRELSLLAHELSTHKGHFVYCLGLIVQVKERIEVVSTENFPELECNNGKSMRSKALLGPWTQSLLFALDKNLFLDVTNHVTSNITSVTS